MEITADFARSYDSQLKKNNESLSEYERDILSFYEADGIFDLQKILQKANGAHESHQ